MTAAAPRAAVPYAPDFLAGLVWSQAALRFRVERAVDLPALSGSALRGMLGAAGRQALCPRAPACPMPSGAADQLTCEQPLDCNYFRVFEQDRRDVLWGENVPKQIVLEPPLPASFLRAGPGSPPHLAPIRLPPGAEFDCGVIVLGDGAAPLGRLLERLERGPLSLQGGSVRLAAARRADGLRLDLSTPPLRRVRVRLLAAGGQRGGGKLPPEEAVAWRFLGDCVSRLVKLADRFGDGGRPPFLAPPAGIVPAGPARLVDGAARRYSTRKGAWMRFEGFLGELELEGELGPAVPLLRAAEIFHVGQKPFFGLGRIRWEAVCES